MVSLGRCNKSCNVFYCASGRIGVPNKIGDENLNAVNMITKISEPKSLTKHVFCDCKCKFDDRKYNSNQKWKIEKCRYECKTLTKHRVCSIDYI